MQRAVQRRTFCKGGKKAAVYSAEGTPAELPQKRNDLKEKY
jgi:hypothetical protein